MSKYYAVVKPDGSIKQLTTMSDDQPDMPPMDGDRINVKITSETMETIREERWIYDRNLKQFNKAE